MLNMVDWLKSNLVDYELSFWVMKDLDIKE